MVPFRVTTQAHKGIETSEKSRDPAHAIVTTQAHKGIETNVSSTCFNASPL